MKRLLQTVTLLLFIVSSGHSQNCGTKIPKGFFLARKTKTAAIQTDAYTSFLQLPDVNLSISVYITNGPVSDSNKIYSAIDSLNDAFTETGISFTACKITPVTEEGFRDINPNKNEEKLTALYHTKNTINLYLARDITVDGETVCGYAYLPSSNPKDYIFVSTLCNIPSVLIHEMGHFFGLLHPHETDGGEELVDGSNCETAGDNICDTEASPNLSGMVNSNCEYSGIEKDANDEYYIPSVANHMSYSPKKCRCMFTTGQYQRMIEFYLSDKTHLR